MELIQTDRWKRKLFWTGLFLLVYMVGAVNVDASVGCMRRIRSSLECVNNETVSYVPCVTADYFGHNDPTDSYHFGLWIMNASLLGIIWSVMWL